MKKIIVKILLLCLIISSFTGILSACNTGKKSNVAHNLKFELNPDNKSYSVVGTGTNTAKEIVIPAFYRLLPVTRIGDGAFFNIFSHNELRKVVIPDTVTSIGDMAFNTCLELNSITIGKGVRSIGEYAFSNCFKLLEVYNLSPLNIVASDTNYGEISRYAKDVYTSKNNKSKITTDKNGFITYNSDEEKILLGYTGNKKNITLPDNTTEINQYAFIDRYKISAVTIPDSVKIIGKNAFDECINLTSVTIGSGVTRIDTDAFLDCYKLTEVYNLSALNVQKGQSTNGKVAFNAKDVYTSLETKSKLYTDKNGFVTYTDGQDKILIAYTGSDTKLTLPSKITEINRYAFSGYDKIKSIKIPNGVTKIGYYAFTECNVKSVVIGNGVTEIPYMAFSKCPLLESITIGNNVTSIGYSAFSQCISLKSLNIPSKVTTISAQAFEYCSSLKKITLPDSLVTIGSKAFYCCSSLVSLSIPDNVTQIPTETFKYCGNLTTATIGNGVKTIGANAFYSCTKLSKVLLKNPNGWKYTLKTTISLGDAVADPATCATYLTQTYCSGTWNNNG